MWRKMIEPDVIEVPGVPEFYFDGAVVRDLGAVVRMLGFLMRPGAGPAQNCLITVPHAGFEQSIVWAARRCVPTLGTLLDGLPGDLWMH